MGVLSILLASAIAAGGGERCSAVPGDAADLKKQECENSVDCWASRVLVLETRLEYHSACGKLTAEELAATARALAVAQQAADTSTKSAERFAALAKPERNFWYESPILWTAVGMFIGGAIVVGAAYAVRPAVR